MNNPDEAAPNHQLIRLLTKALEQHRDALLNIIAVKENLHYDTLRDVVSARVRYNATAPPEPGAEGP